MGKHSESSSVIQLSDQLERPLGNLENLIRAGVCEPVCVYDPQAYGETALHHH